MEILNRQSLRAATTPAILVAVVVVLMILGAEESSLKAFAAATLLNIILVVGLYVFTGNSGVLNFGHVGFAAIGAYFCAFLTIPVIAKGLLIPEVPQFVKESELSTTLALLIAAALTALLGAISAVPLMRLTGLRATIATLALLMIVNNVFTGWIAGGSGQITRVPVDATPGMLGVWAGLCIVGVFAFQCSRWGMRLRATREDEVAARSTGIGVYRERSIAFTLSAFVMGIGGGLYAHYLGSFDPSTFFLQLTFLTIAMLLVGGMRSLTGAVSGALLLSIVTEIFRRLENGEGVLLIDVHIPAGYQDITVALILIAVLLLRPSGITGGREVRLPLWGGRAHKSAAETIPTPSEGDG